MKQVIKLNVVKFFLTVWFCFYSVSSSSHSPENSNETIEKAIGHLILYQTERKINGKAGINSPLTEIFKTYYESIESLPINDRAMFLFMADNHLEVHGGSGLLHFYDFIYLCCLIEYRQLIESNLSNRYFNSELLNRKFSIVKNLESKIKDEASRRERSLDEHKKIMKTEFLEMVKVVNDSSYQISE